MHDDDGMRAMVHGMKKSCFTCELSCRAEDVILCRLRLSVHVWIIFVRLELLLSFSV